MAICVIVQVDQFQTQIEETAHAMFKHTLPK